MAARPSMLANNRQIKSINDLLTSEIDELLLEINAGDTEKIAQELPDVVWFCLTLANIYGIDLEAAFYAKAIRNEIKYPAEMFSEDSDYLIAHALCRQNWDKANDDNFKIDTIW